MTNQNKFDVLIVGAGPTGLTAAILLSRAGLRVRIIDQKQGPSAESRALGIQARTLELFDKLDLAQPLVQAGLPIHAFNLCGGKDLIAHVEISGLDSLYSFILSLPQSETERMLIDALRRQQVEVEWNSTLIEQRSQADHVSVTLTNARRDESFDVPWLLGCDGAHSAVRKFAGIAFAGARFPEWFALADVKIDWPLERGQAYAFLGANGPLAVLPLPQQGVYRLIANLPDEPVDREPLLDLNRFESLAEERAGRPIKLSDPIWISQFLISRRIVDRYRSGRVFLLGDAAHIHSPVGGQGMNTGIHDAFNLAWKLALVAQGWAPDTLLDSYDEERRPIGQRTLSGTRVATVMLTLKRRWAQRLRNGMIRRLIRSSGAAKRLLPAAAMLDIQYRTSSIVEDSESPVATGKLTKLIHNLFGGPREQPLRAGDRAPDFEITDSTGRIMRLSKLLRSPRHVLLWFPGADDSKWAGMENALRASRIDQRYVDVLDFHVIQQQNTEPGRAGWPTSIDASGRGYQSYAPSQPTLMLLRPDGYIGFRSAPADVAALEQYLTGVFTRVAGGDRDERTSAVRSVSIPRDESVKLGTYPGSLPTFAPWPEPSGVR